MSDQNSKPTPVSFLSSPRIDDDEIDHPDHILWQCRPATQPKPTFMDKIRGKEEPCKRINYMENDVCNGCSAKRGVGALAMAREAMIIGELIAFDVHGNEIWRYDVV
ncbi:hypothetical protein FSPOR_6655 [Fusarium sporotrichioides]|uniref:Uncharacterized protein n=1 Tax=Fusarium sporotrichioides TaxID=5514 RepID=A0A395S204_FUSSP|nr:hypothetical protein FSPOR_6655 [Fusarium sporotrichioides]